MRKTMKRALAALLCAALFCTAGIGAFAAVGDINGSGNTNSADARLLLRYCAKLEELSDAQLAKSDFNCDGKVNTADARLLLRAAAKLDSLEYYSNFYVEISDDDLDGAFGKYNGDTFMEMNEGSVRLGILLGADKSFTFINAAKKQYAVISAKEYETLMRMAAMSGEEFDVSGVIEDLNIEKSFPTPLHLIEAGYTANNAVWMGKQATVYVKDGEYYYYEGANLLGTVVQQNGTVHSVIYNNFTPNPYSRIYAFLNQGYTQMDFMEMMLTLDLF